MKLVFIDEFKPNSEKSESHRMYGISVVVLDSVYYTNFKKGFEHEFRKLGWSKEKELKGRYVYSNKFFEEISIDKKLSFAESLFKLSFSETGRSKRIAVYIGLDSFDKKMTEPEIYIELLCRILTKIGKPSNKKQNKNLIAFFLDSNQEVTCKLKETDFYNELSKKLHKDWVIFEKPFFVSSSNLLPGIVFADFISFFHQNVIDTKAFLLATKARFFELVNDETKAITVKEEKELQGYLVKFKKQEQSMRIIGVLRDIIYVK